MAILQINQQAGQQVEPGNASAIRSHQSFDPDVEGVCHHSGKYLTRSEVNPRGAAFLQEQHDFPGFPSLDERFSSAVHAREHQHLIWSAPKIRGLAALLSAVAVMLMVWLVFQQADQVGGFLEYAFFYALLVVGSLACLGLLVYGALQMARNRQLYHQQALGQPPATPDFPVFGSYCVDAHEQVVVDAGTLPPTLPANQSYAGSLRIQVNPESDCLPDLAEYGRVYRNSNAGQYLHAGMIALEGMRHVTLSNELLEFGHRIVLRAPTTTLVPNANGDLGSPIIFDIPYTFQSQALSPSLDESRRMLLECEPRLRPNDSYTLDLAFRWLGDTSVTCRLDECYLNVSSVPELGTVEQVSMGRFDTQNMAVIWRNLQFPANGLVLSVRFTRPILTNTPLTLQGTYQCTADNVLVSGLRINPDRIWNTLGRRVTERTTPAVRYSSSFSGNVIVDTRYLSQEHEQVCSATIGVPHAPDDTLVGQVLDVLVRRHAIDIQRIDQAVPRLDPAGTVHTHLHYWDIVGRKYREHRLDSIDVHVVIAGTFTPGGAMLSGSTIDVIVRGLHDPRDADKVENVELLADNLQTSLEATVNNLATP